MQEFRVVYQIILFVTLLAILVGLVHFLIGSISLYLPSLSFVIRQNLQEIMLIFVIGLIVFFAMQH